MSYLFCYLLSPHHLSYFSIVVRRLCNKQLWKWTMVLILILFKYFWKFSTAVKWEIVSVDSRTKGLPGGNKIKRADSSQKGHSWCTHYLKNIFWNFLFPISFFNRISRYFSASYWWISQYFPATDRRISLFHPASNWQNYLFSFPNEIDKIHCIFLRMTSKSLDFSS